MKIFLIFRNSNGNVLMRWDFKSQWFDRVETPPKFLKKLIDKQQLNPVKYELDGYVVDYPYSNISIHIFNSLENIKGVLMVDYVFTKLMFTDQPIVDMEMILKLKQPVIEDDVVKLFNSPRRYDFNERIASFERLKANRKWLFF
jgi:hypothetical protein